MKISVWDWKNTNNSKKTDTQNKYDVFVRWDEVPTCMYVYAIVITYMYVYVGAHVCVMTYGHHTYIYLGTLCARMLVVGDYYL